MGSGEGGVRVLQFLVERGAAAADLPPARCATLKVRVAVPVRDRLPALQHPGLAKTAGRLLLARALRLCRAGWADSPAARSDDPVVLQTLVEEQRERARAEDRSVKLALERIHQAHAFPGSTARFIRAHRIHRLHDILEAEARTRGTLRKTIHLAGQGPVPPACAKGIVRVDCRGISLETLRVGSPGPSSRGGHDSRFRRGHETQSRTGRFFSTTHERRYRLMRFW
jgi:hypothetical protein